MAMTSVNRLTVADALGRPPPLIGINQGGFLKASASVNQLTETGKATASLGPALTVTFDWRRLQCPHPLTKNARLH